MVQVNRGNTEEDINTSAVLFKEIEVIDILQIFWIFFLVGGIVCADVMNK